MNEKKEIILNGVAASQGIVIGKIFHYKVEYGDIVEYTIDPEFVDNEVERLKQAVLKSKKEVEKILRFVTEKLPVQQTHIFEAELMMITDQYFFDEIYKRILKEKKNADYILSDELEKYQTIMKNRVKNEYLHQRFSDMEDMKNRIIKNLNMQKLSSNISSSLIVIAKKLTPADTILFSKNNILGYATDLGGYTSHSAILSRSLNIPCVVGLEKITESISDDSTVIIDGYSGVVIVNPSEVTKTKYIEKSARLKKFDELLAETTKFPTVTKDNRRLKITSNIDLVDEIDFLLKQNAAGIGLFRTEQLIISESEFPTEEYQYKIYYEVAERIYPNEVTFRTFDIGGDKLLPIDLQEKNTFLGWRGIRLCLDKPEIFSDQLRAILRVSSLGNVKIMFPMISSIEELRKAKTHLKDVMEELDAKEIPYDRNIEIGIMVEVPAIAMLTDIVAKEVDFLSIGTNDLIQYFLAVDRGNLLVAHLYQEFDPSILRILKFIISESHKLEKPVSMCGEMAGNPLATILLIGLGLNEFSVVPNMIPKIKKIIQSVTYEESKQIVEKVLDMDNPSDIRLCLEDIIKEKCPDIIY
jgi:phosphotransferase system enzyme I (PtsI)